MDEIKSIDNQINNIRFWNWHTGNFDKLGTELDYQNHVNEYYMKNDVQQLIESILANNSEHHLATIIEVEDEKEPFVFSPGYHFVNRLGYVIYKGEELQQDYNI